MFFRKKKTLMGIRAPAVSAKIGPADLSDALKELVIPAIPICWSGSRPATTGGDRFFRGWALISTVDFITPPVDDPYWFGQIAAATRFRMSMHGGKPSALNLVMFPSRR